MPGDIFKASFFMPFAEKTKRIIKKLRNIVKRIAANAAGPDSIKIKSAGSAGSDCFESEFRIIIKKTGTKRKEKT